jgi:muramidase (phage lysozyme)
MTLGVERLKALFDNGNIRAFYSVIRRGESSLDARAYRMVSGGGEFTDFSKHPYAGLSTRAGGKAAGAPQFLPSTWQEIAERYGLDSFSPENQDLGYVGCLLKRPGAVEALLAGKFEKAVEICRPEWTSLPGASENNPSWNMDKARALYVSSGGRLDNAELLQPAAPIEDHSPELPQQPEIPMAEEASSFDWSSALKVGGAIASFFNPIVGVAISALGPLVEQKIEKAVGQHTDPATAKTVAAQLSSVIENSLTKVTGKTDPVAAVAEIRASPTAASAVAAVVEQKLVDMTPLLNEMHRQAQERYAAEAADRNDASERVKKVGWNIQKYLVIGGLAVTGIIVGALLAVLIVQVSTSPNHLPDATLIAFAGPLLVIAMQGLREAYAFAFGGTQEGSPAAVAQRNTP